MSNCLNCQQTVSNNDSYCANCGQPTYDLQQSLIKIINKIGHELLDIDGRVMRTLKTLILKPGLLSAQYRDGKRMTYTPPLRMYLAVSVLLFFVTSLLKSPAEGAKMQVAFMLMPAQLLEHLPKLLFIMLPVYALIFQILHPKSKYIFNLVFAVHIHVCSYIALMMLLPTYVVKVHIAFNVIMQTVLTLYLLLYPIFAVKRFYGYGWLRSFAVAMVSAVVYLVSMGGVFELVLAVTKAAE